MAFASGTNASQYLTSYTQQKQTLVTEKPANYLQHANIQWSEMYFTNKYISTEQRTSIRIIN